MLASERTTSTLAGVAPRRDFVLVWLLRAAAALAAAIVLVVVAFLGLESLPFIARTGVTRFFMDPSWNPTEGLYNMMPMLVGTLLVTGGAVVLATPLGVLSAIFCHFYAPRRVAISYRRVVELLAGIPSVVYGFWGLVVLVPKINDWRPPGASLLAATLVLAIMVLPTVAMVTDASFMTVPRALLDGARALGLGKWGTLRLVMLPATRSGLFTGVMLQTGRALGETMAVLMVCGNIVQTPRSLFDPFRTLTANIALEMAYATGDHRSALFASGLLLMLVVAALVVLAAATTRRGGGRVVARV